MRRRITFGVRSHYTVGGWLYEMALEEEISTRGGGSKSC